MSNPPSPSPLSPSPPPTLRLVLDYLRAIEQNADEARLAAFFAPNFEQREFPNRLIEKGAARGLPQVLEGSRKGRTVVQNQRYDVKNALVDADRVALELTWTAELKVPLGSLEAGATMTTHSGMFFRIRNGRIVQQHNYDCFEPF
jgi:ketosteroid isomerase-like protein